MPTVTIITSVYNTEQYLEKSVTSVLNQSFADFEYIIINNGSTDQSKLIIEKFCKKDHRIVFIDNKQNYSLAEARNQALDIAQGKYIYIVDSDDYIEKNTLDVLVSTAEKDNLDLVVCGWDMEYFIRGKEYHFPVLPKKKTFFEQNDFRKNAFSYLNQSILTVPWNKLYLRKIIDNYGIRYRNTKLEDHHFNMDYIKNISSAAFLDQSFYHYLRNRPGSELEYVYKFDLFKKKKEHFAHSKEVLEYWQIQDKKSWDELYTFFAERVVQSIQEVFANCSIGKNEKKKEIRKILDDIDVRYASKFSKPEGLVMKMMVLPLRMNNFFLCTLEVRFINWFKRKHFEKYIQLQAKNVNKVSDKNESVNCK